MTGFWLSTQHGTCTAEHDSGHQIHAKNLMILKLWQSQYNAGHPGRSHCVAHAATSSKDCETGLAKHTM
jgi:hypothetical protein